MNVGAGAPRLTIVIPTLNRADLVGRAIESALAQSYPEIEIVVSNNGSTDGTRDVLDMYADRRLRVIHREKTIPAAEHGNVLLEQARGQFFLGLSDDDWIEPSFAQRVIELYERHPDLSFVWTGCVIHYADAQLPARIGPEVESGSEFLAAFLAGKRDVCWCACVSRTDALRRVGPIPPDVICGDIFYWTKLAERGRVGCVPERLSHYVQYRDFGDGMAGGSSVPQWAREASIRACAIVTACTDAGSGPADDALRQDAIEFVARSTANQFVWQALRGVNRFDLWRDVRKVFPCLRGGSPGLWLRVIAALLAPGWLLRNRVIAMARSRANVDVEDVLSR